MEAIFEQLIDMIPTTIVKNNMDQFCFIYAIEKF